MLHRLAQVWTRLTTASLPVATAVLTGSFVLLLVAGLRRWPVLVVAVCAAGVVWGGIAQRRALRSATAPWVQPASRGIALALFVVGLLLLGWYLKKPNVLWMESVPDGVLFVGFSLTYFGLGRLVTHFRWGDWGGRWRGPRILAVCGLFFTVAMLSTPWGAPAWVLAAGGAAALASPVGLAAASEDAFREPPFRLPGTAWLVGGGLASMAVAVFALLLLEVPPLATVVGAATVTVLLIAIASDTDADIMLVLLAVLVIWGLFPRGAGVGDISLSDGESVLVALGDSYISGEGAERFFDGTNERGDNECRRAPTAYPVKLVTSGAAGVDDLVFIACSGAKAAEIWDEAQHPGEPIRPEGEEGGGLDQLAHYEWLLGRSMVEPRLVLVSIGGNDAGFGTIGRVCSLPGDCSVIGQKWLDDLEGIADDVSRAYQEIRATFPGVPVVAVPYPVPLNSTGCVWSALTPNEHLFLNGFVNDLDSLLRQEAARAGLHFLDDVVLAFKDSNLRICDDPNEPKNVGVNFLAANPVGGPLDERLNPRHWFHNSLHPNKTGHEQLTKVVARWIATRPGLGPAEPDPSAAPHDVRSVVEIMGGDFGVCGSGSLLPYCDGEQDDWVRRTAVAFVRDRAPFVVLLALGAWAVALAIMRRSRGPNGWFHDGGAG